MQQKLSLSVTFSVAFLLLSSLMVSVTGPPNFSDSKRLTVWMFTCSCLLRTTICLRRDWPFIHLTSLLVKLPLVLFFACRIAPKVEINILLASDYVVLGVAVTVACPVNPTFQPVIQHSFDGMRCLLKQQGMKHELKPKAKVGNAINLVIDRLSMLVTGSRVLVLVCFMRTTGDVSWSSTNPLFFRIPLCLWMTLPLSTVSWRHQVMFLSTVEPLCPCQWLMSFVLMYFHEGNRRYFLLPVCARRWLLCHVYSYVSRAQVIFINTACGGFPS